MAKRVTGNINAKADDKGNCNAVYVGFDDGTEIEVAVTVDGRLQVLAYDGEHELQLRNLVVEHEGENAFISPGDAYFPKPAA